MAMLNPFAKHGGNTTRKKPGAKGEKRNFAPVMKALPKKKRNKPKKK